MIKQFEDNKELRFCKILNGTKKPFEQDWTNKPYTWEEIQNHISQHTNYGVLCGIGGLAVIDSDTVELRKAVEENLPSTFRIKTGSGGTHDYYICKDLKKKIVLTTDKHWGEVQSFGSQVVGANSKHPNGNIYYIINDAPIIEITYEQLIMCIKPFMKEIIESENRIINETKSYGDSDINSISIMSVISSSGFKTAKNGEQYGSNPWHGSSTGMNFWVSSSKNIAHCFRCNCGVSAAKAIALNEGIIRNCSDDLRGSDFMKTLDIAVQKYGLKRSTKCDNSFGRAFQVFTDKVALAKDFSKEQPIYYDNSGLWWLWNKQMMCWELKDEIDISNYVYMAMGANTINSKERTEIIQSLKQVGRLNAPKTAPNTWIQFRNGIVDINEPNKIIEPSSNYFVTNPLPWNIGLSDKTPVMDKIFNEWVGENWVNTLYEILSYSILADYPIHRIFCFMGAGMNGKSSFLDLQRIFVGTNNLTSTELDTLLNSRFEITRLHKRLVCQMGETNFNEMNKTSMLKKLTGNDLIGFEYKNKNPFTEKNYAKIIISTNNLPSTGDKTIGFYRRWLIVDFPNQFNEKKDILSEIPKEEYENLGYKAIFILNELLKKREFTNEGSIEERQKRYEDRSNPFEKFWEENVLEDSGVFITKKQFSEKINAWCKENRFREITDFTISKHMKEKKVFDKREIMSWVDVPYGQQKPRMWVWDGIKWK